MRDPKRGEVWIADLGIAAKVRPVLIISAPFSNQDYALLGVIPHTTAPRGAQFDLRSDVPWLQPGSFNIQGMMAVPHAKFIRKLGSLSTQQMKEVEAVLRRWLVL